MFRTIATTAILALTIACAQAGESLDARVHEAAVKACAPESSTSLPLSHYGAITQYCVARVSTSTMAKIQADERAKTRASTAILMSN
jgi:hypothetical protein